jgi:hypothetical protein
MSTIISDYTNLAIKGLQEPFRLAVKNRLESYLDIDFINFGSSTEYDKIYSSLEGVSGFRKLGEVETPDVKSLEQGYNTTISAERGGLGMNISQTTMVRAKDDTTKIDAYLMEQRDQLLKTVAHGLVTDAFAPYNEAFSSTTYLAPDGICLCGTHTYNGGGTFTNAKADEFSEDAIDKAWEYAGDFTDQAGKPMPLSFTAILVKKGSAVAKAARQYFASGISPVAVNDVNIYEGEIRVIETPYITTANKKNFFFIDTNLMVSPVVLDVVEYPTFQEPMKQANESITSNITGYWRNGIAILPVNILGFKGAAL